jgi:hypothetical protein
MERGRPGLPGQPRRVPLCALRRAHPCPFAPSASHRSPRNRTVVRPLGASPLRRRNLSPGQLCSSPQFHCSVKPLCSPRLRGEFSRRLCSARRPALPIATWARPLPAITEAGWPVLARSSSKGPESIDEARQHESYTQSIAGFDWIRAAV